MVVMFFSLINILVFIVSRNFGMIVLDVIKVVCIVKLVGFCLRAISQEKRKELIQSRKVNIVVCMNDFSLGYLVGDFLISMDYQDNTPSEVLVASDNQAELPTTPNNVENNERTRNDDINGYIEDNKSNEVLRDECKENVTIDNQEPTVSEPIEKIAAESQTVRDDTRAAENNVSLDKSNNTKDKTDDKESVDKTLCDKSQNDMASDAIKNENEIYCNSLRYMLLRYKLTKEQTNAIQEELAFRRNTEVSDEKGLADQQKREMLIQQIREMRKVSVLSHKK